MYDDSWYDMEYKDVENCILDIAKSKYTFALFAI